MVHPNCSCPQLKVVKRHGGRNAPGSGDTSGHTTVLHASNLDTLLTADFDLALVFAQASIIRKCQPCREGFTKALEMPSLWWSEYCRNSNGYFGCEESVTEDGVISAVRSWALIMVKHATGDGDRIPYEWTRFNLFTVWLPFTEQTIVVAFEASESLETSIRSRLLGPADPSEMSTPFWMYARLAEEVVERQDRAVWAIRDLVRGTEKSRVSTGSSRYPYLFLHEVARHATHVSECLELGYKTMDSILAHHDRLCQARSESSLTHARVRDRLVFFRQMLDSLQCRSKSNKERLQSEISLAFNTVSQNDARASIEIARAAQVDSGAMRTIAFLTLTFLPATFICAIFSMSFFNYDGASGEWRTSPEFWRYWALAGPVTLASVTVWYFWSRRLSKRFELAAV